MFFAQPLAVSVTPVTLLVMVSVHNIVVFEIEALVVSVTFPLFWVEKLERKLVKNGCRLYIYFWRNLETVWIYKGIHKFPDPWHWMNNEQ